MVPFSALSGQTDMTTEPRDSPPPSSGAPSSPANWRLLAVLVGLLIAVALFRSQGSHDGGPLPAAGDGSQGFVTLELKPVAEEPALGAATVQVPWRADLTVYDATLQAGGSQPARTQQNQWQSRWQGTGEMAFLLELGGIANQGGDNQGGNDEGLNWLFEINGKRIDRGAGAQKLEAGDRVLWKFDQYE